MGEKDPKISIIAAIDEHRGLGIGNKLLFDIPEDLTYFRNTTQGKPVIMGRKTFESIGRPLPKRPNIIITRQSTFQPNDVMTVSSLHDAIEKAKAIQTDEVFIIGGASVYKEAIDIADRLYITRIHATRDADAFFPEYESQFPRVVSKRDSSGNGYTYTFWVLERE